jgi:hypothetical protein
MGLLYFVFNSHCVPSNCYYYYYYYYVIITITISDLIQSVRCHCQIRRDILGHGQDIDKMAELRDIKNIGIPSEISCLTDVMDDSEGIFCC